MNGFDDFDTKQQAEEFYRSEGWQEDHVQEFVTQDQSLSGGFYHGPSNQAGLTAREYWVAYWEARWEWEDEQARLRDEW